MIVIRRQYCIFSTAIVSFMWEILRAEAAPAYGW